MITFCPVVGHAVVHFSSLFRRRGRARSLLLAAFVEHDNVTIEWCIYISEVLRWENVNDQKYWMPVNVTSCSIDKRWQNEKTTQHSISIKKRLSLRNDSSPTLFLHVTLIVPENVNKRKRKFKYRYVPVKARKPIHHSVDCFYVFDWFDKNDASSIVICLFRCLAMLTEKIFFKLFYCWR